MTTLTAPLIPVRGGFWLTPEQYAALLEASEKHRESLKVEIRSRTHALVLTDADYELVAGQMESWRTRYLTAVCR